MTGLTLPVHDEPITLYEKWIVGICVCEYGNPCVFHQDHPNEPAPRPLADQGRQHGTR